MIFLCICRTFHEYSVCLQNHPSTSVTFSCIYGTFCQLSVRQQYVSPASLNFPCIRSTFYQLPSTFRTRGIFRKQFAIPQNLLSTSVDFPCICGTYCKLAPNFREAGGPPVNFPSGRLTFCQHSLHPENLSTYFNFSLLLSS